MTNILVVHSSQNTETSGTRALVDQYINALTDNGGDITIKTRDLGVTPPPHLDGPTISAFFTPSDDRSDAQKDLVSLSDELVSEIRDADMVIVGSPMQNFGVTSGLKAWFDHIARVGETFSYTENGPEGLLGGRKVVVVTASGGDYTEHSPLAHLNHQTPHLKTLFGFVGVDDLEIVEAPGTAMGEDGIKAAEVRLEEIATDFVSESAKAA